MSLTRFTKSCKIKVASYHAGLNDKERAETQRKWTDGHVNVVVATVAFGMGIDKSNVQFVVHWNMPKTIEGFYQESGRAGRDGTHSLSVLYYTKEDAKKFSFLIQKNAQNKNSKLEGEKTMGHERNKENAKQSLAALERMINYCEKAACRRQNILDYFGEKIDPRISCNKTCDYCSNPTKIGSQIQLSQIVKEVTRFNSTGRMKNEKKMWDGQWNGPHGDSDEEDFGDNWGEKHENSEILFPDANDKNGGKPPQRGFVKASEVFAKYEVSLFEILYEYFNTSCKAN